MSGHTYATLSAIALLLSGGIACHPEPLESDVPSIHSTSDEISALEERPEATSSEVGSLRKGRDSTDVVASNGLTAGYAMRDLTWRAGAKPGQVGTEGNTKEMVELWRGLVRLLLHAYRFQTTDRPEAILQYATAYTKSYLEQRTGEIRYDEYTDVFEPGRGIHTRATVKAFVLENGGSKVAVVRADMYLMQKHLWRRVAELVGPITGLSQEDILISATHNHSAADAAFTAAGISSMAESYDPRHFAFLTHTLADAIIEADENRVPARMSAIRSTLRAVQRNVIGPATAEVVPPGGTEAVTVAAGYPNDFFDDTLTLLTFEEASSHACIGHYLVFGMHPESLEDGHGLLSSDFIGPLESGLEAQWGCPVAWAPGALGDVEPDNGENFGTDFWREDFVTLEKQAETLVEAISPVLTTPSSTDIVLEPRTDIVVSAKQRVFPGPANTNYPGPTPYQLPVTEYISHNWPVTAVRALTESANISLTAIQLGDVVLLGSPNEVTTDLAMHMRSRMDATPGNLYQGYVWPDSPDWVVDEIDRNFDTTELSSSQGFLLPVVLSQVNDWMGYVVTRWEFNNRSHYRQSLTLFGDETANYISARLAGLCLELRGASPETLPFDQVSTLDLALENEVYDALNDVDDVVADWTRNIPEDDPLRVGRELEDPYEESSDEMGAPAIHFSFWGSSSDLPIPRVTLERTLELGIYEPVLTDDDPSLWILYHAPNVWEIVWHEVDDPLPATYRFRVQGVYRGTKDGTSPVDPLFDPDGRNVPYEMVSDDFVVQ